MTHGYLIGHELGTGGMGRVLSATRTWDGLRVALKLLHPGLSRDPVARRTIATEALATAALMHDNVVSVLDLDEHPEHGMFVVSELVVGDSMRKLLDEGLRVDRGLAILRDVLAALGAAHAAGVVHGDLKPSNVLITSAGHVKVCDFGIAQIMAPTARGAARRSAAGTPRYMPPEQFVAGLSLDPRTDLYAAGVMLYELLYQTSPFPRGSIGAMAAAKLAPASPPPHTDAGWPVPPGLRQLLTAALHPDLRRRPRFAAEFAARIAASIEEGAALGQMASKPAEAPAADDTLITSPPELFDDTTSDHDNDARTILLGAMKEEREQPPRELKTRPGEFRSAFIPTSHLPGTALIHMRPPPIVGREAEKARLLRAAEEVIAERRTQVVLVSGALGSGKSRMADWLCAWAESTGAMEPAIARFSSYAGRNASGLRGMVSALFAPAAPSTTEAVRATSAWIARIAPGQMLEDETLVAWLVSRSTADSADPYGTASLALGALCAYAAARPLCLWFDDLSLAEDGSIELVARLAGERPQVPILVIATVAEPALEDASFRTRMGLDAAQVTSMRLPLLTHDDRAALLRALLPLRPGVAERAAEEVGGIPLFLVQRVEHWVEARMLVHGDDGLAPEVDDAELYRTTDSDQLIDDRVAAHLARAPQSATVLYLLALLGPFGDGSALVGACADVSVGASVMDLVLEEGLCKGILRARADEVTFAHSSLRASVLRRAWTDARYPKLAAAAAKALSAAAAVERPGVRSYVAVLQRDAGEVVTAFETLMVATEAMAWGGDLEQAGRQLVVLRKWERESEAALTPALEDELDLVEARIAYFRDDLPRVRTVLDALFLRFQERGTNASFPRALTLSANTYFFAGDVVQCETVLETLRREVPEARDPTTSLGGRACYVEANVAVIRGNLSAAAAAYDRALENGDGQIRWLALGELAEIEAARGNHDLASVLLTRARSECGPIDVYQMRAMREKALSLALARNERKERRAYVETVRAQSVDWYRTAALVTLAAWDATFAPETVAASARTALEAFARKPHDEPLTHLFLTRTRNVLRSRGDAQLAARATMLLAERAAVGAQRS